MIRRMGGQLALVLGTILCALGVGYAIAALTGTTSTQLQPGSELVVAPQVSVAAEATTAEPAETSEPAPAGELAEASEPAEASAVAVAASAPAAASPSAQAQSSTASPAAEQPEVFIDENFDQASNSFPPREDATWSAAYVDGRYQLTLNGQTNIGLVGDLPDIDYRLDVEVSVYDGSAGLVFLGAAPKTSYRLVIAPNGAYSIERQDDTTVETVVDLTPSEALEEGSGALNQLRVERRGDTIAFFANNRPLTTFEVPAGDFVNRYGFVLSSRNGEGRASFDNLRGVTLQ